MSKFEERRKQLGISTQQTSGGGSSYSERFASRKQALEDERKARRDKIEKEYHEKYDKPAPKKPLDVPNGIKQFQQAHTPKPRSVVELPPTAKIPDSHAALRDTFTNKPGDSRLLRSNNNVHSAGAPKPALHPFTAAYDQLVHGAQSAVDFQQQPTNEVPSTGNKTMDNLLREAGGFLPGLASGQSEAEIMGATSKGVRYLGAKLLPKAPITNKIVGHTVEAGLENARVGAAAGQTDTRQVAENFGYGAAFGAVGSGLKQGVQGAGRYVRKIAKESTANNPIYQSIVNQIGESGAKAEIGKRNLSSLDEQINLISKSNVPNKPEQLKGLFGERNDVIAYIKQHESEFEAPKPRVHVSAGGGAAVRGVDDITPQQQIQQGLRESSPAANLAEVLPVRTEFPVNPTPIPPQQVAPEVSTGVRANFKNQLDNGNFSSELQDRIKKKDQTYVKASNADDNAQALEMVRQDLEGTQTMFMTHTQGGSLHTAIGYQLMKKLDALGKHEDAAMVSEKLAADLTNQGQGSQAAIMLQSLSPEGQLVKLIKKAANNGKTVPPEVQAEFKNQVRKSQKAKGAGIRENQQANILDKLRKGEEPTPEDIKSIEDHLAHAEEVVTKAKAKAKKSTKPRKAKEVNLNKDAEEASAKTKSKRSSAPVQKKVKDINLDEEFPDLKEPKKREKVVSFLKAQEEAALARIKARKNNLNALPLDEWADHGIVVASQIAQGTIHAATHVEDLVKLFGKEIEPVATFVYTRAQGIVRGTAKKSVAGKLEEAKKAFNKATGKTDAEKAVVEEMAKHVKHVIDNAKKGKVDASDLQQMRDYADEIAEMYGDGPKSKVPNEEEKYLQAVKSLSKKLADVEKKGTPASTRDQQEIEGLIRQISNLKEGVKPPKAKKEINVSALSNVAHDLLKKPRPLPKIKKTPAKEVSAANKALVQKLATNVKSVIEQSKKGQIDAKTLQMIRDNSAAVAKTAGIPKVQTAEQKFLQSVKSLAKKVAKVETVKVPTTQLNREVEGVLRNVVKLQNLGKPKVLQQKVDSNAVSNIAHDLLNRTRPNPKPTTLQEKIVAKYIKQNPQVTAADVEKLRALAKDVTTLEGKQGLEADMAMQKILNSYEKASPWDMVQAVRYLMMLGNEGTQIVNAVSGPIMAMTGTAADVIPAMVDLAMHKAFKTKRNVTLYGTDPLRFMADWFKNAKMGGRAGYHGVNPAGIQNASEIRGIALGKGKYNPFGQSERVLGAVSKGADYGTYKTVFDAELKREGYKAAVNSGVKGRKNIQEAVRQFVNEPTAAAVEIADRMGKNTTFQRTDSLGAQIANLPHMATGKSKHVVRPLASAIMPFVRTPLNIASTAVTMTPVGMLKGLFQLTKYSDASSREALRTLGMSLVGSAGLSSLGYYLSSIGIITGANDSGDKDVDAIKEQAGRGKYRFNTSALNRYIWAMLNGEGVNAAEKAAKFQKDDNRFDYNKVQPLAFPLAIGAGMQEAKAQGKGIGGQLTHAGTDAFGSLLGMSSLKTLQDVVQPSNTGTAGEKQMGVVSKVIESFAKSFSPSFLGQDTRRQDQNVRKTSYNNGLMQDVKEYYQSRLPNNILGIPNPFNSTKLPPQKTTLGQDKLNPKGITGTYANPFKSEKAPYNDAAVIISDLIDRTGDDSLAPSAPEKKVSGKNSLGQQVVKEIPVKRYLQLQEELGSDIIKQITSLPSSLSDADKAEKIKEIYKDTRKKHMDKVKGELGIIVKR